MGSSRLSTHLVSWALAIAVALGSVPLAFAANICDPSTGTNCAAVNSTATGGGVHTSEYDLRSQFTGQKATYSAATTTLAATVAGTAPFFSICGSGTKTIRIQRLNINQSVGATAASRQAITLRKTSTATSAGTATALTQVPHDSNSAAGTATVLNYYTTLATAGALVGTIGSRVKLLFIAVAVGDNVPEAIWDFTSRESEAIVLRGTGQCLEAGFGTTPGTTAPTIALAVTWTEE